ncbi:MAG: phosphatase PAP2 family protein [Burkholderiales bacterium]|nr:phosphatase PAP2 family protein [Burkholderiales bacterium]
MISTYKYILLCFIASLISILWIDKSLALFIHEYRYDKLILLRNITEGMPAIFITCVIIAIFIKFYKTDSKINLRNILASILASSYFYIMLKITLEVKTLLKVIFGRYWPLTWTQNNLSLIKDNVYGFNWFHGYNNLGSFPSGHSTLMIFCAYWLSLLFPKQQMLFFNISICSIACLIILNYHYLGDCLAGIGIGLFFASLSIFLYEILCRVLTRRK